MTTSLEPEERDRSSVGGAALPTEDCFVVDSEFGRGRFNPADSTLRFFDSPGAVEFSVPAGGRKFRRTVLQAQDRVWSFNGDYWEVGRIDGPPESSPERYYVHFPNGRTVEVLATHLKSRWSRPVMDPLALLSAGTVESRFFHTRRGDFVRSVADQRAAAGGLGGILSSGIDLFPHQVGTARRVLSDPVRRYLLADEVGLGKTIEAGMVLRQLLTTESGSALILVPDHLVWQWETELRDNFRIDQFPGRVAIRTHSEIAQIEVAERELVVVDEAHRLTDGVAYLDVRSEQDATYRHLVAIAHASNALLLLSATPVRTNEDGFLGLLHLLDPLTYPLEDLEGFRLRVALRDELAETVLALSDETPVRYLSEPAVHLRNLIPDDPALDPLIRDLMLGVDSADEVVARSAVRQIRVHLAEAYRLHRRMIRNRRTSNLLREVPVRGRTHQSDWLITDPDQRRRTLFRLVDDLRDELEANEGADRWGIYRTVMGRASAPMESLIPLAAALERSSDHDLSSSEEESIKTYAGTPGALDLAQRLRGVVSEPTRLTRMDAIADWARKRVGNRKAVVVCSFPRAAESLAQRLRSEFGEHRVSAFLSSMPEEQRNLDLGQFKQSGERCILVMDRAGEEGTNLQFVDEVLHASLPTTAAQLEQRIGRFDRWADAGDVARGPIASHAFTDSDAEVERHFGAWLRVLDLGVSAFDQSCATLQYVLADAEQSFLENALSTDLFSAGEAMIALRDEFATQRRRIAGQDLLDSIDDRAVDEALLDRISQLEENSKSIFTDLDGYVREMLGFSTYEVGAGTRFSVSKRHPPMVPESEVQRIGTDLLQRTYTADRPTAKSGLGLLRWGDPLVNNFHDLALRDDRGRAFAVEAAWAGQPEDAPAMFAFCFDVAVNPDMGPLASTADLPPSTVASASARIMRIMPTSMERVWWMGDRGECPSKLIGWLEKTAGLNLGSRPARFLELTANTNWDALVRRSSELSVSRVSVRDLVTARISMARQLAASEYESEMTIIRTRARVGATDTFDGLGFQLVQAALANPQFTIESCGVVALTGRVAR